LPNSEPQDAVSDSEKANADAGNGEPRRHETVNTQALKGEPGDTPTERNRGEQRTTTEGEAVAPSASGDWGQDRTQANEAILRRIGISPEAAVSTLARTAGLTPLDIVALATEAPKDVRNLAGWLRKRIETGSFPSERGPKPEQIAKAAQRKWLVRIGEHRLDLPGRSVKWNGEGVYIMDGERKAAVIPAGDVNKMEVG
jgi:hypothetical protein